MAENVCKLLDNLSRHNSRAYGYELSQNEVLQILKLFDDVKELEQYRAIGTVEEIRSMIRKSDFSQKPSREELISELKELSKMKMMLECYEAIGTIEDFKALKENRFFNFDSSVVRIDEKSYNKAIDDFAEKIKFHLNGIRLNYDDAFGGTVAYVVIEDSKKMIDVIAEGMKGGGE